MAKLKAVIFDLDGVLVTTDHYHYLGWKCLADELGMAFTEQDNHQLRGVSRAESLKLVYRINNRPLPSDDEFTEQMTRKNGYYVEYIKKMQPSDLLPGSVELLTALRESGIRCAIASSSKNAGLVVERTDLGKYLDAVVDGNHITKSKPDPEVFLMAAQKLGAAPECCIGVEDAEAGVEAIKRAGMPSVGIGSQGQAADLVVESVSELDVGGLRGLVEGAA